MKEIERVSGKDAKIFQLPISEQSIMVKNFIVNKIWYDNKIKRLGFTSKVHFSGCIGILSEGST